MSDVKRWELRKDEHYGEYSSFVEASAFDAAESQHAHALAVERGKLEKADAENQRLVDRIRELELAIKQHNDGCQDVCGRGEEEALRCGQRRYFLGSGRRCPDCPMHHTIDLPVPAGPAP